MFKSIQNFTILGGIEYIPSPAGDKLPNLVENGH
jgi:hypothetical protein